MNRIKGLLTRTSAIAGLAGALVAALASPASAAVAAHLSASPTSFVGGCPAVITFNGKIKSTAAGVVTYKFIRSDGAIAPVQTLTFRAPGVQTVSTTWTLGGIPALPAYAGWEAIEILSPMAVTSKHANFKIRCVAGVAPNQPAP